MLKKRVDLLSDLNSKTAYLQCKQMWCVLYFKNRKTKKEIKHADAIKYLTCRSPCWIALLSK